MPAQLFNHVRHSVCLTGAIVFGLSGQGHAQAPTGADGLGYLQSVAVGINLTGQDVADGSLDSASLRNVVELELRKAGLPVVAAGAQPESKLLVEVQVIAPHTTDGTPVGLAYELHVDLVRGVILVTGPPVATPRCNVPSIAAAFAVTWNSPVTIGVTGTPAGLEANIRRDLVNDATAFANDYLRANSGR